MSDAPPRAVVELGDSLSDLESEQSLTLAPPRAVVELGDSLSDLESERCLLLANHQSTGDVPLLMAMLSARRRAADNVLWIMDAMFRWTHFGVVSQVRSDFFVESVSVEKWPGEMGGRTYDTFVKMEVFAWLCCF